MRVGFRVPHASDSSLSLGLRCRSLQFDPQRWREAARAWLARGWTRAGRGEGVIPDKKRRNVVYSQAYHRQKALALGEGASLEAEPGRSESTRLWCPTAICLATGAARKAGRWMS